MYVHEFFICEDFVPLEPWATFERKWLEAFKKMKTKKKVINVQARNIGK